MKLLQAVKVNNTKKGVTLVELVISCIVMVLLAGACTAVLISGQKLFLSGSQMANNQLEASLLQNTLLNMLPKMVEVELIEVESSGATVGAKDKEEGVSLFFDNGKFTIRQDESNTNVNKVVDFSYDFQEVGTSRGIDNKGNPIPRTSRAQFVYVATLEDGRTISGGMVLANTKYADVSHISQDANKALHFSIPKTNEDLAESE